MEQCRRFPWDAPAGPGDEKPSRPGAEIPKNLFMDNWRPIPSQRSAPRSSNLTLLLLTALLVFLAVVWWVQHSASQGPITYRIGALDERFSLKPGDAAEAMRRAAGIWSSAAGRELFKEDPAGAIVVRFVYDYRQEASDKLKGMNGSISYTKSSYDALKARYEREAADFKQNEELLNQDAREYNRRADALNAEIGVQTRKGMTEDARRRIVAEQDVLAGMLSELQRRQDEQRRSTDDLNKLISIINEIAASLNLEVVNYNRTGKVLAAEFNEGLYERKNNRETITIYHFTSRDKLVRVLAHELGHALGLKHSSDPMAIMYRLNQSDSLVPSPDEIAALKAALENRGL